MEINGEFVEACFCDEFSEKQNWYDSSIDRLILSNGGRVITFSWPEDADFGNLGCA